MAQFNHLGTLGTLSSLKHLAQFHGSSLQPKHILQYAWATPAHRPLSRRDHELTKVPQVLKPQKRQLVCLFSALVVEEFSESFRINLQRLIVYAQGTDPALQREVAERLANEAVKCISFAAGCSLCNCVFIFVS